MTIIQNPPFIQVLAQVAICTKDFYLNNQKKLIFKGFTHVFSIEGILSPHELKRYRFTLVNPSMVLKSTDIIKFVPKIFDFVRQVYLFKGKLLFVEDPTNKDRQYIHSVFLREGLLYVLATLFKCSVYEMWNLINNQVMRLYPDSILQHTSEINQQAERCHLLLSKDSESKPALPQLPMLLRLQHFGDYFRSISEKAHKTLSVLKK
jgi:hypothetical protein